jgi:hypothetical protein
MKAELGRAEFALGNHARAVELLEEAVAAYRSYVTPDDAYVRRAVDDLGTMREEMEAREPPRR